MRVAGVASVEAVEALCRFQIERGHSTLSKALGAALEEWRVARGRRVVRAERADEGHAADPAAEGVLDLGSGPRQEFPFAVRIDGLKEFARARLPPDHSLRDALLAEADILTPQEFLAKLQVWCVLVSRTA